MPCTPSAERRASTLAAEPLLSVILPAHNEAENIPKMARRLAEVLTAAHIR